MVYSLLGSVLSFKNYWGGGGAPPPSIILQKCVSKDETFWFPQIQKFCFLDQITRSMFERSLQMRCKNLSQAFSIQQNIIY